ncbi:MAG: aminotransferase class I/II-fold pyridoxal phosphate-dependent enzyme [Clostridiales bacterium]|nr:aminotransferase class I/II-fold pyridoxal phosphate-dependent enzyme [Clostridiales bacterium]
MKYDFESIIDRRGQDAWAVDDLYDDPTPPMEGWSVIPMWVADMSFATCPTVLEAMAERCKHPCFGYYKTKDEYWNSIIDWQTKRNGVVGLERKHLAYENGVLGGVVGALNVLCSKGDNILVHSPTYVGFTSALENNGWNIVHSELKQDENGIYRMDYEDMEQKIKKNRIHACVFCSPHNPTGRVWEREELEKAYAIFEKYDVKVVSDEIWSDLIRPGYKHIPSQSVNEWAKMNTVAEYAITKTFNMAGLIGSYRIIYNKYLAHRIDKDESLCHYNDINVFSQHALIGAYKPEGHEWVDELNQVLAANIDKLKAFLEQYDITMPTPQGTYLLFADCTKYCEKHGITLDELEKKMWDYGVSTQDGRAFHGACHIRINVAIPPALLDEAIDRLEKYVLVK